MDKRFLTIVLLTLAALGAIFYFTRDTSSGGNVAGQTTYHVQGAGAKNVEIIEYGDFQCPACGGFYPILKGVKERYGDDIKFVFRNFPLDSIHPNARAAHRAAEAADKQGKFWEMHDMLYEGQENWTNMSDARPTFEAYATELQLNMDQFNADFNSEAVNADINADIKAGQAIGVQSTPTFVINGKKIDSDTQQTMRTVEGFSKYIDKVITDQGGTPPAAAPASPGGTQQTAPAGSDFPAATPAPTEPSAPPAPTDAPAPAAPPAP